MFKLLFAILNYMVFVNVSFADHPEPPAASRGEFSDNKEYIYVIWVNDDDKEALAASSKDVSAIKIHKRDFPKEGLYKYKSKKILWSIEKLERDIKRNLYPLDDGIYLIKEGERLPGFTHALAFSFYKSGKLVKSYKVSEVCNDEKMFFHTSTHFFWKWEGKVDNKNKSYSFYACKKKMNIDVTTGKLSTLSNVSDSMWENKQFSNP